MSHDGLPPLGVLYRAKSRRWVFNKNDLRIKPRAIELAITQL